jgi:hypothetical protein
MPSLRVLVAVVVVLGAAVAAGAAPPQRIPPGVPVGGLDRAVDFGFSLFPNRAGTRFTKAVIYCGGANKREAFYKKRFTARFDLPVASRLKWSGPAKVDNSGNYSQPIPGPWTGPVRLAFDLRLTVEDDYAGVTGIARLTGPGLPCPAVHRLYSPR